MLSEKEFKNSLISKLKGWRDGDLDKIDGPKADLINDSLKIAIEIKDDVIFSKIKPEELVEGKIAFRFTNIKSKNRQFKGDLQNANKKFKQYPGYRTIVIIRTEMVDSGATSIKDTINGPWTYVNGDNGLVFNGRPSNFWREDDQSTSEIGAILFWEDSIFYVKNDNPNTKKERKLNKEQVDDILQIESKDLNIESEEVF